MVVRTGLLWDSDKNGPFKVRFIQNSDGTYSLSVLLAGGNPADALVDHSGSIASASSAQTLMNANPNRVSIFVQNQSSAPLWINDKGSPATGAAPDKQIMPNGGSWESQPNAVSKTAISIWGATAGQAFTADEGVLNA